MQLGNALVIVLLACLALTLILMQGNTGYVDVLADHSILFIIAAGIVGLVGAREKTPFEA
ncbi:MAG: hypothetical protein MI808_14100 [Pseudomonadales bacterium]|nr:hypothetical protein [Pseudomonadales bacterium]